MSFDNSSGLLLEMLWSALPGRPFPTVLDMVRPGGVDANRGDRCYRFIAAIWCLMKCVQNKTTWWFQIGFVFTPNSGEI